MLYISCVSEPSSTTDLYLFCVLIVCLFVCAVDHGVNEGEPVNEQYCEQVNEDQFRDPEPEGQCSASTRTSRKALKTASSIPPFDACFCPSFYKHNLLVCFTKLHMFCLLKTRLDSHPP